MSSVWGKRFIADIFGESHGSKMGVVMHGVPAGTVVDFAKVRAFLDRRRAGGEAWSTPRNEEDDFEVVSGYFDGHATGTPLTVLFYNRQQHSEDYAERPNRPGHADYTGFVRYGGCNDPRGGGHFSGRLTAPLVFAGAVAAQLLEARGVYAATHVRRIATVEDMPFDKADIPRELAERLAAQRLPLVDETRREAMEQAVVDAASCGDSLGGVVECALCGVPAGVGSPMMDTVESALASLLFAVPAVKGISFGEGFGFAGLRGSEANDAYAVRDGRVVTTTNHNGGVIGGITTGMPIVFEAAVKPTASISLPQQTVNLQTLEPETIAVKGRHDACIVPRAAAAIEAAACIALLDCMLERNM
jgi:chorismate synthase